MRSSRLSALIPPAFLIFRWDHNEFVGRFDQQSEELEKLRDENAELKENVQAMKVYHCTNDPAAPFCRN